MPACTHTIIQSFTRADSQLATTHAPTHARTVNVALCWLLVQGRLRAEGPVAAETTTGRQTLRQLHEEYSTKLTCWVREQQVAALHAWACALGLKLHLRAFR
eukprot:3140555-Pleurochrysis_carterae.AAC.1